MLLDVRLAGSKGDVSVFLPELPAAQTLRIPAAPAASPTPGGFRDLLEIGRQKRPDLYDMQADKPPTLVPRDLRLEVPERMRHDGTVEVPLDEDAFRNAVRTLRDAGVEAVAVCFLYGFVSTAQSEDVTAQKKPFWKFW